MTANADEEGLYLFIAVPLETVRRRTSLTMPSMNKSGAYFG